MEIERSQVEKFTKGEKLGLSDLRGRLAEDRMGIIGGRGKANLGCSRSKRSITRDGDGVGGCHWH